MKGKKSYRTRRVGFFLAGGRNSSTAQKCWHSSWFAFRGQWEPRYPREYRNWTYLLQHRVLLLGRQVQVPFLTLTEFGSLFLELLTSFLQRSHRTLLTWYGECAVTKLLKIRNAGQFCTQFRLNGWPDIADAAITAGIPKWHYCWKHKRLPTFIRRKYCIVQGRDRDEILSSTSSFPSKENKRHWFVLQFERMHPINKSSQLLKHHSRKRGHELT